MTEREVHLELSKIKIDDDNIDYIKKTGEICGKLRDDLVKLFATPDVSKSVCKHEWIMTADSFDQTCYCKKCGKSS